MGHGLLWSEAGDELYFAGRNGKALWESVIELAIDLMDRSCDRLGSSRPVTILELTGAIQDASSTHNQGWTARKVDLDDGCHQLAGSIAGRFAGSAVAGS